MLLKKCKLACKDSKKYPLHQSLISITPTNKNRIRFNRYSFPEFHKILKDNEYVINDYINSYKVNIYVFGGGFTYDCSHPNLYYMPSYFYATLIKSEEKININNSVETKTWFDKFYNWCKKIFRKLLETLLFGY